MIPVAAILLIILIHWFADFVCQTDKQAKGKSVNNALLSEHVGIYTLVWVIPTFIAMFAFQNIWMFFFIPITFGCHWVTDYYTSRVNAKLFKANKIHDLFVSIGFDQFLHYAQIFITFYLLLYAK